MPVNLDLATGNYQEYRKTINEAQESVMESLKTEKAVLIIELGKELSKESNKLYADDLEEKRHEIYQIFLFNIDEMEDSLKTAFNIRTIGITTLNEYHNYGEQRQQQLKEYDQKKLKVERSLEDAKSKIYEAVLDLADFLP
jgi:hypothetical protein